METSDLYIVVLLLVFLIGSASFIGMTWNTEAKMIRKINGTTWIVQEIQYDEYQKYAKSMDYLYSDDDIKPGFCFAETGRNWEIKTYKIIKKL